MIRRHQLPRHRHDAPLQQRLPLFRRYTYLMEGTRLPDRFEGGPGRDPTFPDAVGRRLAREHQAVKQEGIASRETVGPDDVLPSPRSTDRRRF